MGLKLVLVNLARVLGIYSQKLNKDVGFRTNTRAMGWGFKSSSSPQLPTFQLISIYLRMCTLLCCTGLIFFSLYFPIMGQTFVGNKRATGLLRGC